MHRSPSFLALVALLALALGFVVGGCDRNGAGKTSAAGAPGPGEVSPAPSSSSESDVEKRISNAVAKLLQVKPAAVEVELIEDVEVPGLTVFKARATIADDVAYSVGVVQGDQVVTDQQQALNLVAKAWKYGRQRTVPADQVAAVFGVLEGAEQAWMPIVNADQLEPMSEDRKKLMFLPRETEVDGKPAVQYWVTSAEPPLWLTTAVIDDHGAVSLSTEEHWVF
jgi:hypothetical protein